MVMPDPSANQQMPMGPQVPHQSSQAPLLAAASPDVARLKSVPDVRQRRLIGASAWALALGSCGLVLGVIAMIRLMGEVPGWFEPSFVAAGVVGLALIIAAFVTVRFRLVPWVLLGASTAVFVVGVVLLGSI